MLSWFALTAAMAAYSFDPIWLSGDILAKTLQQRTSFVAQ